MTHIVVMRLDLASVARLASIAIVASLFGPVYRPRLLPRRCPAFVAAALHSTVASAVAVSAHWLVVTPVASVASRLLVGVTASIVVATIAIVTPIVASPAERTVPVVSSALALA